jgi:hypothetical protein
MWISIVRKERYGQKGKRNIRGQKQTEIVHNKKTVLK